MSADPVATQPSSESRPKPSAAALLAARLLPDQISLYDTLALEHVRRGSASPRTRRECFDRLAFDLVAF